jgi:hypothetical protein
MTESAELTAALRHQLAVLRRKLKGRARLTNSDRWFFVQLYRWFPSILQVFTIIPYGQKIETAQKAAAFQHFWSWAGVAQQACRGRLRRL